jgi:hypothetical protein
LKQLAFLIISFTPISEKYCTTSTPLFLDKSTYFCCFLDFYLMLKCDNSLSPRMGYGLDLVIWQIWTDSIMNSRVCNGGFFWVMVFRCWCSSTPLELRRETSQQHKITQLMGCVQLPHLHIRYEALGFRHPKALFSNLLGDP